VDEQAQGISYQGNVNGGKKHNDDKYELQWQAIRRVKGGRKNIEGGCLAVMFLNSLETSMTLSYQKALYRLSSVANQSQFLYKNTANQSQLPYK